MDRFFLAGLVREVRPELLGRRARGVLRWGEAGLSIPLRGTPPLAILVSLFPEAPGFCLGDPPRGELLELVPLLRFKKLLTGAEVVDVEASPLDRVLFIHLRRARPSGAHSRLDLVVEWITSRQAAYLVEPDSGRVLDVFSRTPPRREVGETFAPLAPPPGAAPLAASAEEFAARLDRARRTAASESAAVMTASGLSPLLAGDLERLQTRQAVTLVAAFAEVRRRLNEAPRPTLLHPKDRGALPRSPWARLSPIDLEPPSGWEKQGFSDFNSAAQAYLAELGSLSEERLRREMARALDRQTRKEKYLLERIVGDAAELPDAGELSRRGEALLAGVKQARPVEGGVEVPDPYSPEGQAMRVPLDPRFGLLKNAERYFQRSRKVARSRKRLAVRGEEIQARLDHLGTLEVSLDAARGPEELTALMEELRGAGLSGLSGGETESAPAAAKPGRAREARLGPLRFRSSQGGWILVGRSARSNEELTFRLAKPDELWFHAAGTPGAHVVLRREDGRRPSPEEIEEAAAAAAFFSKARGATAAEVVYTERKQVRKIPGAPPGTVRVSEFRAIRVRPAEPQGRQDDRS